MSKSRFDLWFDYDKELTKSESKLTREIYNFYKKENDKCFRDLQRGSFKAGLYFSQFRIQQLFIKIYKLVGLQFANWWVDSFAPYVRKNVNTQPFQNQWEQVFTIYAREVSELFGNEISNTATINAQKVFVGLMQDPEFASLGNEQQARILLQKSKSQSMIYAKRLAKTEATRISNLAIQQSALTFYNKNDMNKVWISARDGRERDSHMEAGTNPIFGANSKGIPMEKDFMVGGMAMSRAGDPRGGAKETVNCRCVTMPIPNPDAQTIADVEGLGFGTGFGQY